MQQNLIWFANATFIGHLEMRDRVLFFSKCVTRLLHHHVIHKRGDSRCSRRGDARLARGLLVAQARPAAHVPRNVPRTYSTVHVNKELRSASHPQPALCLVKGSFAFGMPCVFSWNSRCCGAPWYVPLLVTRPALPGGLAGT